MTDLFKEIWQTLSTNRLRTLLTGLSVAWGIFMLILLLSISNGVINSTKKNTQSNDPNRITVWGGYTTKPYKGLKEGRNIRLKDKYMADIKDSDRKYISSVEGEVTYHGVVSTMKDYLASSSCRGVYPKTFNGRYKLKQGRYINEADIREKRKVVLLHADDISTLFNDTTQVTGKTVKISNLAFTVIGVFEHEWNKDPCIPYSTALALNSFTENLDQIEVHMQHISDTVQSGMVECSVKNALAKAANFDPSDPSAVYTYDRYESSVQQEQGLKILNGAMWVIGILTLITGIVGVSNIMFVSVRERTHEIGIRRAIGAKPRSILTQVVLESVVLTTVFGYVGIVMGTLATEAVKIVFGDSQFMLNPEVDLSIALEVTIALILAGALAGIFPALKALKVKPVEALRDE